MLTVIIDVRDCLCNGSIGTLIAVLKQNGEVKILIVKFDSENSGREMRRCHPQYTKKYPGCTPIQKQVHKYSTSSSSRGAKTNAATVQQFPLILSFASTTHKIQGQTIKAPQKVAVDLRSVFGANQAYVMLGRVEERNQLFIVESLAEKKIWTDQEALKQLAKMKAKSINRNPPVWEKTFGISCKIFYHNIHSLKDKFEDIKADLLLPFADLIILGETWLETNEGMDESLPASCQTLHKDTNKEVSPLHIIGYKLHINGIGKEKD